MDEIRRYAMEGLNLQNKTVLDAALGAGYATFLWAKRIDEEGGTSRIISVDTFDIPGEKEEEWKNEIEERLGGLSKYVKMKKADIFNLDFLEDESIDIINCDDTLVFLNPRPLKVLNALSEFKRVLKKGGFLVIVSEIPVEKTPENEGQWKRWGLAKAIYELKGETWSVEPHPNEVKFALELLNFEVFDERTFPSKKDPKWREVMDEWKGIMLREIESLEYGGSLKSALEEEVHNIYEKVRTDGYLTQPPMYVLKSRKK